MPRLSHAADELNLPPPNKPPGPHGLSGGMSYALPGQVLRSASRVGRDMAEAFIEQRYHCRGPEETLGTSGIVIEGPVPFRDHLIVFGPVLSIAGLLHVLAPLRRWGRGGGGGVERQAAAQWG
jgi:hypothetical protein